MRNSNCQTPTPVTLPLGIRWRFTTNGNTVSTLGVVVFVDQCHSLLLSISRIMATVTYTGGRLTSSKERSGLELTGQNPSKPVSGQVQMHRIYLPRCWRPAVVRGIQNSCSEPYHSLVCERRQVYHSQLGEAKFPEPSLMNSISESSLGRTKYSLNVLETGDFETVCIFLGRGPVDHRH